MGHHHHHRHGNTEEVNRKYWDEKAASYDTTFETTVEQLIDALRTKRHFIGADWVEDGNTDDKSVTLLDYACGPGTVSRALNPYVTRCIGIDLSPNMVAEYNARAKAEDLYPSRMSAVVGNLLSAAAPIDLPIASFDVVAISHALHHVDDPTLLATRLVSLLRPGGVFLVADLLAYPTASVDANDDSAVSSKRYAEAAHTVTHHGFAPEAVRAIFDAAGAGDGFALEPVEGIVMPPAGDGLKRTVFFARGNKRA